MSENTTKRLYTNINITEKDGSEIEIEGEIPTEEVTRYRTKALKKLGANISIDGFRKGHVPEKVLIEKVGEDALMGEVAEMAIGDAYPQIVMDNKLAVIGQPQVTVTKLAVGNPIGFKVTTAVLPEITLPDYKKIAEDVMKEEDDLEVSTIDVDQVLLEVRRGKARFDEAQKKASEEKNEKKLDEATAEDKTPEAPEQIKDEDLPELDDDFVKTIGGFASVEEFKKKVTEDLKKEKVAKAKEKKRVTISEQIIEQTNVSLPQILVDGELEKMLAQMKDDVARVNMKFEDYLTNIKKTEEDLKNEWREQAVKRATLQLILNEISRKEEITADHDEVHKQMDTILEQFKDANPEHVHTYVETMLTNEAVFQFLEKPSQ